MHEFILGLNSRLDRASAPTVSCGREVSPSYALVRDGGAPCRYCAHRAVDPHDAVALMAKAKLRPLEPSPGTAVPWRCQCEICLREVTPRYPNVHARGHGCMFCAAWGFDYTQPSTIYLIRQPEFHARKISIAGRASRRLRVWRQRGWIIERTWDTSTGAEAYRAEQAILAWWRGELGLGPVLRDENSWTETVDEQAVSAELVAQRVDGLSRLVLRADGNL